MPESIIISLIAKVLQQAWFHCFGWCCTKIKFHSADSCVFQFIIDANWALKWIPTKLRNSVRFWPSSKTQVLWPYLILRIKKNRCMSSLPRSFEYIAAPLSDEKNTNVFLDIPKSSSLRRILPTLSSSSRTASPYLMEYNQNQTNLKWHSKLVGVELVHFFQAVSRYDSERTISTLLTLPRTLIRKAR